ncbi:MAG: hypothetical protein KIS66_17880, partial [Fimbriimonadaceae bacterium]|nr:hypothetical protein [Fimbriimonadaceae bacterium]
LGHEARVSDQKRREDRLETDLSALRLRLERLYLDRADGLLSDETYGSLRTKIESEIAERRIEIAALERAGDRSADEALATLELALEAPARFDEGDPDERNETLRRLLSNCLWNDGRLEFELRNPYDLMLKAVQNGSDEEPTFPGATVENEDWWAQLDSN